MDMRRLTVIALLLGSLAVGWTVVPKVTHTAPPPPDDPAHGLVFGGLRRQVGSGACRGNFELAGSRSGGRTAMCTHGPDPAPAGVDIHQSRPPVPASAQPQAALRSSPSGVAAQGAVPCDGDGTSGYRVQLIYARANNVTDRYSQYAGSFPQWAGAVDSVFSQSAAETGGDRHVRFVHDGSCNPVVVQVTLSKSGDDNINNTINELHSLGYTRSDRKYLVWMDANVYCGIAQVYYDDSPDVGNNSNGDSSVSGEVARVDSGCWGQSKSAEAHELMHTLGGVQTSAPHATPRNHCRDEYDRMCYADGSGGSLSYPCPSSHEALFDCNHDDYFSTSPAGGSYLATHWNTASSRFLIGSGTSPTTTTSTTGPAGTATTTRAPTTTTTRTTLPPVTTTTSPPGVGVPSAPQSLRAAQAAVKGIALTWLPPVTTNGAITGYKIYRGASPSGLSLLEAIAPGTSYADAATTSGLMYFYQVSAVNSAGEGPRSSVTGMVAK
jgi:hypothetical protein